MSLINEMLKNLDNRRGRQSPPAESALTDLEPAVRRNLRFDRSNVLLAVSSLGILCLLVTYIFWPISAPEESKQIATGEPAVKPTPALASAESSWLARAANPRVAAGPDKKEKVEEPQLIKLEKVELSGSEHTAKLSFYLSEEASHSADTESASGEDDKHRLQLVISGSELEKRLDPLNLQGSLIEGIQTREKGDDVYVELTLKQAVTAQTNLTKRGGVRLVLDLRVKEQPAPPSDSAGAEEATRGSKEREMPTGIDLAGALKIVTGDAPEELPASAPAAIAPFDPMDEPGSAGEDRKLKKVLRPPTAEELAESHYTDGEHLLRQDKKEDAAVRFRSALEAFPAHRDARSQLAHTLWQLGQDEEAESLLEVGLRFYPRYRTYLKLQARILTGRNAIGEALEVLKSGAPPLAKDPEYHAFLAALYQRRGEHGVAVDVYRRVLKRASSKAAWWMGLAISLEAEEKPGEALTAYRSAWSIGNLDSESMLFVGRRIRALESDS